jgi:hypothetical protein
MSDWTRRQFLAVSAALVGSRAAVAAQPSRAITIASEPFEQLGDYGRGLRLGAAEAERAAMLLGHRFAVVQRGPAIARVAETAPPTSDIPVVAMRGTSRGPCVFVTESSPEAVRAAANHAAGGEGTAVVADWHGDFRRFGAGELNERFVRAFDQPMTPPAWHGWVAIKAIVEAAIRGEDLCAELARLRFDGHKGRALTFDPSTRRLRHPALIVRTVGEKQIIEVVP